MMFVLSAEVCPNPDGLAQAWINVCFADGGVSVHWYKTLNVR